MFEQDNIEPYLKLVNGQKIHLVSNCILGLLDDNKPVDEFKLFLSGEEIDILKISYKNHDKWLVTESRDTIIVSLREVMMVANTIS